MPPREMMVSTGNVIDIAANSAKVSGQIVDLGDGAAQYGHCYATKPNVTVSDSTTKLGVALVGSFTSQIKNLVAGTKYYIKAYISKGSVIVYGHEISFITNSALVPILTTTAITDITQTSASSGGNIPSDGGASVTARGVCWNTSGGATLADSNTSDGLGSGSFTSSLTGLTGNTKYFVKAYATNSAGTAYGNEIMFYTSPLLPTLTTAVISSIALTTARSGGNITDNGGAVVTGRGVCWNTSPGPIIGNSKTSDGLGSGSFTSSLTGLTANQTYYVRAYAINSVGSAYGNELVFTTLCSVPSAITNAATMINTTTATLNGTVNANNFSTTVTFDYGTTTNYGSSVTAAQSPVTGSNNTSVSVGVTSLSAGTLYHYRVNTVNCGGTILGSDMTFATSSLVIGNSYQGGIVAYILLNGDLGFDSGQQHGLIAAPGDQSTAIVWFNGSYITTGATAIALGTGNANTNTIVAAQGEGSYAAKLCYDLVLGGYSDWYLPSKDELNKLYLNRAAVGGFGSNSPYWSSTEDISDGGAWRQFFDTGNQMSFFKNLTNRVRAIRSF
jgi:hypothetical protein